VKTAVEARAIPGVSDHVRAFELVRAGIECGRSMEVEEEAVIEEAEIVRAEVDSILESVVDCGGGSVAQGVVKAFELGLLDIPFAPSVYNRGEVATVRDTEGAVRFLSPGRLRLDPAIRDFHEQKVEERRRAERVGPDADHALVERDIMSIAAGDHPAWPLDRQGTPSTVSALELAAVLR
jgi:methylaspartate mutase epsilon subunit